MTGKVIREDSGRLCTLTLNRPEKLNALDLGCFEELDAHLAALEQDGSATIGCVILRGAGRGFCAGADLGALSSGEGTNPAYKSSVIRRLELLPLPVIAAVHGACFTGGLELALACDFIVADPNARFADTHGKWGLVGAWGMTQRLPRRIGLQAAKRVAMTARVVGAKEAEAIGLVDLLAEDAALDTLLATFTAEILANSGFTNSETKKLLIATDGLSLADGLAFERDHHPGKAPDYLDRIAAFKKT